MENSYFDLNTKHIEDIRRQLAKLPKGYISRKIIGGKERFYLQWREDGKVKSRYLRPQELPAAEAQVSARKALENKLRTLTAGFAPAMQVAEEPFEYGFKPLYYLKWNDTVIAKIDPSFNVHFSNSDLNKVVSSYTKGKDRWNKAELSDFLADRIISPARRDIEALLFKLGLTKYDVIDVAVATRAINSKDLLWIAKDPAERFEDVATEVFRSVFTDKKDLQGNSVDTPEGYNIKRYGVFSGRYGIYKQRLSPLSKDAESELAVCKLAQLLSIPVCPCFKVDSDTVFSAFEYDFSKEYIVHFRQILGTRRTGNDLMDLISARPSYLPDFARMIALDFITRQDDRHLSNIAVKISPASDGTLKESFYPLYDNGRSLFYEDTEETALNAAKDVRKYATAFGPSGSYYDHAADLAGMGIDFSRIMDLGIKKDAITEVLASSGFSGYRLKAAAEWISECIKILKTF